MEFTPALTDILKFAITLVSIVNPVGAIPVFLGFVKNHRRINVKKLANHTATAVTVTILISLIAGQYVLSFFGISIASFTIAGGFLLTTTAFSMISGQQSNSKINSEEMESIDFERELGIIPLAIPLLSGPGAISTSIIHAKNFSTPAHWILGILMILVVGFCVKFILMYAEKIGEKLGQIGLNVMTRIMGLILLSMSIEMIAYGIKEILPILKGDF